MCRRRERRTQGRRHSKQFTYEKQCKINETAKCHIFDQVPFFSRQAVITYVNKEPLARPPPNTATPRSGEANRTMGGVTCHDTTTRTRGLCVLCGLDPVVCSVLEPCGTPPCGCRLGRLARAHSRVPDSVLPRTPSLNLVYLTLSRPEKHVPRRRRRRRRRPSLALAQRPSRRAAASQGPLV